MNRIRKCLFPVAGYGTRFLPATKAIPKEMLPILTKPLIQYSVEEVLDAGMTHMIMVTSKHKDAIQQHFEAQPEIESIVKGTPKQTLLEETNYLITMCQFYYIQQKRMLGLGHAIYTGKPLIKDEPFAVVLPDDLCINQGESVLAQMLKVYESHPECCVVAVEVVPETEVNKYGVIDGELLTDLDNMYLVKNMVEKPEPKDAPSNLAIIGRYILTPEIFEVLSNTPPDHRGEIQITDALNILAKKGKVIAFKFHGKRYDCGTFKGYLDANNALYKF